MEEESVCYDTCAEDALAEGGCTYFEAYPSANKYTTRSIRPMRIRRMFERGPKVETSVVNIA